MSQRHFGNHGIILIEIMVRDSIIYYLMYVSILYIKAFKVYVLMTVKHYIFKRGVCDRIGQKSCE